VFFSRAVGRGRWRSRWAPWSQPFRRRVFKRNNGHCEEMIRQQAKIVEIAAIVAFNDERNGG
jgi:hypothetical protein